MYVESDREQSPGFYKSMMCNISDTSVHIYMHKFSKLVYVKSTSVLVNDIINEIQL